MRSSGTATWRGRLALLAAAMLPVVRALYEDEVGQYEWLLQQLGKPTALAYSAEASGRVFVASASGVVASVALKDGAVQWRRVASPKASKDGSMRLLRSGGRSVISVTEGGTVQAWKSGTGDLTWQREYGDGVVDLLIAGQAQKQSAIVVRESEVEARTMAGKHEWSVKATETGAKARFWASALASDESTICLVAAAANGAGAETVHVEAATGKVLKKAELPKEIAKGLGKGKFIVAGAHVVVLAGDSLHAHPVCGEGAGGSGGSLELSKVKSKGGGKFRLQPWQGTRGVFAATTGTSTAIFGLGPKGLKHLRSFEGAAVVGPVFSAHDDETGQPVAVAIVKKEGTQVQLMDPASGNVQPAISAPGYAAGDHGDADLLLVHELSSGEHNTVISAADHSFAGIQGTKVQWVREESLANIKQAVFYARSTAASIAERAARPSEVGGGIGALVAELPGRLTELVEKPFELASMVTKWVTPKRQRSTKSMNLMPNARVPTSSEELRDFGADKLIIAVTHAAKLFALEATTSEIIWQRYLGADASCLTDKGKADQQACKPWLRLLPSTSAVNVELLVVAPPLNDKSGQRVMWFEPLSGEVMQEESLPAGVSVSSVLPLPRKDLSHSTAYPFLLIDSAHNVHTMPSKSVEAAKLVEEHPDRFFHYEVDKVGNAVHGFAVKEADKKQELLGLWNLELGSVGEKVVAATSPKHREWDHVPVHIKADASILFKYINRNMLVVVSEEGSSAGGNSTSLNLYALDAVTGHVLHQSHIPGGAAPVNLVACDNWIIMHYHNPRKTRFEVSVVEFFQAKADDGPWDIIFGGGKMSNQTKSAHHLETPVPLQQTYIFPAGVTSMGVTATLKGITPRSIIMALTTDHIFRVSKDMLNPRRPLPGNPADQKDKVPAQFAATKEEMLPPYQAVLPLRPTDVLTYYNPMGQVNGIISSPSALESTSLVFCYGLDLFFMPVQTAKAYDVLSPGFNYLLLYVSVGSVVGLYIVTSFIASHKALQDRWK